MRSYRVSDSKYRWIVPILTTSIRLPGTSEAEKRCHNCGESCDGFHSEYHLNKFETWSWEEVVCVRDEGQTVVIEVEPRRDFAS